MAGRQQGKKELFWGWVFFAPTLTGLLILNIIPIFQTIYKSFFQTGAFGRGDRFVGFANYVKMFSDSQVWQSLLNTFVYAIIEVPISIAISLVLAALLNRKMKGRSRSGGHGMEMALQLRVRAFKSYAGSSRSGTGELDLQSRYCADLRGGRWNLVGHRLQYGAVPFRTSGDSRRLL